MFRVRLDLNLFGQEVAITTSVWDGYSTPFLLSCSQLQQWDAVIGVRDNVLTLKIGGQTIEYTCPCSKSNLMLLDLLGHNELKLA